MLSYVVVSLAIFQTGWVAWFLFYKPGEPDMPRAIDYFATQGLAALLLCMLVSLIIVSIAKYRRCSCCGGRRHRSMRTLTTQHPC